MYRVIVPIKKQMKQTTNSILMVVVAFRMNEQTVNNYYQSIRRSLPATVNAKAQEEFDTFVECGVDVFGKP
jgi:hypothetical protein